MMGAPVSRRRIVSRAWLFSAVLHGGLLAALSISYVAHTRLHEHAAETTLVEVSLLRESSDAPPQPLAEFRDEPTPFAACVLRPTEQAEEPDPVVVTALEDEPFAPVPAADPLKETQMSDVPSVRFDAAPLVQKIIAQQKATGDGGGGAPQGSGGAPALPDSASGIAAAGRGGAGSGSGNGIGGGSGSGNRSGFGSAAPGHGIGTGHGDGVGSGTGGHGGAVASKPARVRRIAPASYPRDAQRAGHEGLVKVLIHVLPSGTIDTVEVVQSSGYDSLDSAACSAARQSSFEPREEGGVRVASDFTQPYRFTLHSR